MYCDPQQLFTKSHWSGDLSLPASVVTVGAFDGVHRGHQALIRKAVATGRAIGVPSVVYTFDPLPKLFFARTRGGADQFVPLTTLSERLKRIAWLEPDHIVVARFDHAYASRTAAGFVRELRQFCPIVIWAGADFRFGSCQRGDPEYLGRYFDTRVIDPVRCTGGDRVSSTRIRGLRACGRVAESTDLEGWGGGLEDAALPPEQPYRGGASL
ncbi:hypothetical protein [Inquilinus sp.]|jgi:riboflavin kinase/FMN adenylyltransferase|uniref:hypothetical protein n=1 Tax=Inquilinus sp. TaxID=1932117 RepID=UPI0037849271